MEYDNRKMGICDWLISLVIPLQLYINTSSSFIPQSAVCLVFIAVILLDFLLNHSMQILMISMPMYAGVIICFIALPILCFHVQTISGLMYICLQVAFLLFCDLSGRKVYENSKILDICFLLSSAIVIFQIIVNISEINPNTISSIFYANSGSQVRYRASFGFVHPNFTALSLCVTLLLTYLRIKGEQRVFRRILLAAIIAIEFIALLCSGSRTGAICVFVFVILELLFKFLGDIASSALRFIIILSICVGAIFLIFSFGGTIDTNELSTLSSGRYSTIVDGINQLAEEGRLLFGYTVTNVSEANATLISAGVSTSDNWYYIQITRFGIVGLVAILIPIIYVIHFLYQRVMDYYHTTYTLSAIIALMIYGVGENVVYNQGVALSVLIWILIFSQLNNPADDIVEFNHVEANK
ncbi:MAG: hypothetical protein LUF92_06970 [Clostridiales bacterium]|nr:hypothetical protein [Clostridiales bacterium]